MSRAERGLKPRQVRAGEEDLRGFQRVLLEVLRVEIAWPAPNRHTQVISRVRAGLMPARASEALAPRTAQAPTTLSRS